LEGGVTEKQKPRLHLVRGGKDPELYDSELDWYFGSYDSECGLQSVGIGGGLEYLFNSNGTRMSTRDDNAAPVDVNLMGGAPGAYGDKDPYTDRHVSMGSDRGTFTRGRRVWQRLKMLEWSTQEALKELYTPRQFNPAAMSEAVVRWLHLQWRAVGRAT
jgi:hypothetical protein